MITIPENSKAKDFQTDLFAFTIKSKINNNLYLAQENKTKKNYVMKVYQCGNLNSQQQQKIIEYLEILTSTNYPTLIPISGFTLPLYNVPSLRTITDYMVKGSLRSVINSEKIHNSPRQLDLTQKYKILLGIAAGMKYLHSISIYHHNFRPENILLDENLEPKISDFVSILEAIQGEEKIERITVDKAQYLPPEFFTANPTYESSTNVYSFGMICYELFSLSKPFPNISNILTLKAKLNNGERPTIPNSIPEMIQNLIAKCLNQTPSSRPTFEEIYNNLSKQFNFPSECKSESISEYLIKLKSNKTDKIEPAKIDSNSKSDLATSLQTTIVQQNEEIISLQKALSSFFSNARNEQSSLKKEIESLRQNHSSLLLEFKDKLSQQLETLQMISSENEKLTNELQSLTNRKRNAQRKTSGFRKSCQVPSLPFNSRVGSPLGMQQNFLSASDSPIQRTQPPSPRDLVASTQLSPIGEPQYKAMRQPPIYQQSYMQNQPMPGMHAQMQPMQQPQQVQPMQPAQVQTIQQPAQAPSMQPAQVQPMQASQIKPQSMQPTQLQSMQPTQLQSMQPVQIQSQQMQPQQVKAPPMQPQQVQPGQLQVPPMPSQPMQAGQLQAPQLQPQQMQPMQRTLSGQQQPKANMGHVQPRPNSFLQPSPQIQVQKIGSVQQPPFIAQKLPQYQQVPQYQNQLKVGQPQYMQKGNQHQIPKMMPQQQPTQKPDCNLQPQANKLLNGIFANVANELHGNPVEKGIVAVSGASLSQSYAEKLRLILDFAWNDAWFSRPADDAFIVIEFNRKLVNLSAYVIRSPQMPENAPHLKSWVIEASNTDALKDPNGARWVLIDSQLNCQSLNGPGKTVLFQCKNQNSGFFKFFRLRQTGPSHKGKGSGFALTNIEFYGQLKNL